MNTVCPAQIHGQLAGYCSVNTSNIEGSIFIYTPHANTVRSDECVARRPTTMEIRRIYEKNTLLVH